MERRDVKSGADMVGMLGRVEKDWAGWLLGEECAESIRGKISFTFLSSEYPQQSQPQHL